jgi:hypothetical protein
MMSTVLTPLFVHKNLAVRLYSQPDPVPAPVHISSPICIFVEAYALDHVFPEALNE